MCAPLSLQCTLPRSVLFSFLPLPLYHQVRASEAEASLADALTSLEGARRAEAEAREALQAAETEAVQLRSQARTATAAAETAVADAAKLRNQAGVLVERMRGLEAVSERDVEAGRRAEAAAAAAARSAVQLREVQQQYDEVQGELYGCRLRIEELEKQVGALGVEGTEVETGMGGQ